MKEIKDYLHLYLGSECLYEYKFTTQDGIEIRKAKMIGFCENGVVELRPIDKHGNTSSTVTLRRDVRGIKLILRPLSDMTNSEAQVFYRNYWGKDYAEDWSGDTGSAYFNPKKVQITKEHTMRIFEGLDYETGDFLTVARMIPQLLRCGFDLFGLIESGLAISKTQTQEQ